MFIEFFLSNLHNTVAVCKSLVGSAAPWTATAALRKTNSGGGLLFEYIPTILEFVCGLVNYLSCIQVSFARLFTARHQIMFMTMSKCQTFQMSLIWTISNAFGIMGGVYS